MKYFSGFILVAFMFFSCGNHKVFTKSKELKQNVWTYSDSYDAVFAINDSKKLYDIYFQIDYMENYPFQNIYLKIEDNFQGNPNSDTITVNLFDKYGIALGKKSGEKNKLNILLRKSFRFPKQGDYKLKIEQFTRKDSLPDVSELCFYIENTKTK